jgi:hypothetical protein
MGWTCRTHGNDNCKKPRSKETTVEMKAKIGHNIKMYFKQNSSVSTVSDHGLDDWEIEIPSPVEAKVSSSSLCVHMGSGAQPASCPMGKGGPFPGDKARSGRDADHSPHYCRNQERELSP